MKKALLGLVFVATLMTSCKEETKEEVKEAREAISNEMEGAIGTAAVKVDAAADSTRIKAGEILKKGADKINQAAEKLKESGKE
ncbi:hypothetical protein [Flavobacterium sp. RSP49]|uniref:hypothetical protein n=1 Tax=Flavobacterium sp. RSP49 TaxID=2497487 RepID=UPI0018FE7929|nr:hypothetical protein [Flavobacterium sp. RSP49]